MKFLCNTEFYHSGVRLYTAGTVYNDITPKVAEQLIALDEKKSLGALSFFTPVDEEAVNFIKGKKGKQTEQTGTGSTDPDVPPTKQPTRAELIAEAKALGIKKADFMKVDELKEAIAAARQNDPTEQTGGKEPDPSAAFEQPAEATTPA
jgi:hypothetical protein